MDGGDGVDTAYYYSSASAVNVNLATSFASGGEAAGRHLGQLEYVVGANLGGDNLIANGQVNYLFAGQSGDDIIDGGGVSSPNLSSYQGDSLDGGSGYRCVVLCDFVNLVWLS